MNRTSSKAASAITVHTLECKCLTCPLGRETAEVVGWGLEQSSYQIKKNSHYLSTRKVQLLSFHIYITHEINLLNFIQLLDISERFSLQGRTFNANHDMSQPFMTS